MILVPLYHVPDQLTAALPPHRVVVAVDHASLWVGRMRIGVVGMPPVVHHAKVRVVPRHPLRRGPVRCEHHVEPHRQAVPGREVEHRVVVVEVVDVPRRFHPVPVRRAAHDPETRRPDVGKVLVPALGFRSAPRDSTRPQWGTACPGGRIGLSYISTCAMIARIIPRDALNMRPHLQVGMIHLCRPCR